MNGTSVITKTMNTEKHICYINLMFYQQLNIKIIKRLSDQVRIIVKIAWGVSYVED